MPDMLPAPPQVENTFNSHPPRLEGAGVEIYPAKSGKRRWGRLRERVGYVMVQMVQKHKD